jgi:hypothetical protein
MSDAEAAGAKGSAELARACPACARPTIFVSAIRRHLVCYGHADDAESIATIHAALEVDITMLDTGDFYGAR